MLYRVSLKSGIVIAFFFLYSKAKEYGETFYPGKYEIDCFTTDKF